MAKRLISLSHCTIRRRKQRLSFLWGSCIRFLVFTFAFFCYRTSMSVALKQRDSSSRTAINSVEEIRRCFPALTRAHNGYPVAYFDGPGGTQVPHRVVEAMNDYLYRHNANTHWAYPSSEETDAIIDSARSVLADFLNASPAEIVFGANMTALTFHLARALAVELEHG